MKTKKPEAAGRGRLKLALLAAFFLLPVAGSWVAWRYELVPGTVGNYGTLLPPRGFVVFYETNLGFALSAGGEDIYFRNAAQTRVIDAVRFEDPPAGQ